MFKKRNQYLMFFRLVLFIRQIAFICYLGNSWILALLNIPVTARNQLSSAIVFLTSESFTIQRNGSSTKQKTIAKMCAAPVPTCPWPNIVEPKIDRNEPTNSVSQTTKVTLMFTSVSLRLLILEFSDSNLSRFFSELRFLKNEMLDQQENVVV